MSVQIYNILLSITFLFGHIDIGSCLVSAPSRYHGFSRVVRFSTGSSDIYEASTNNYNDALSDYVSSASIEWSTIDQSETDDLQKILAGIEEPKIGETNKRKEMSEEDIWVQNAVDEIHNSYSTVDDVSLYDTSFDEPDLDRNIEDSTRSNMDDEIAMLVRCNESPNSLLIEEGRAFSPLTKEEKDDVSQLVVWNEDDTFEATDFLLHAVETMFRDHAIPSIKDGILSMDRACVASWMTKALGDEEEGSVSQHDRRVLKTLSKFSKYGSGRMIEENLQTLYFRYIVGDKSKVSSLSAKRHLELRANFIDAVWRDIRAHGILSPVEEERMLLVENLNIRDSELTSNSHSWYGDENSEHEFVDECEILDWGYSTPEDEESHGQNGKNYKHASSHKQVEMANDNKTPLRIRDGDFVFIDEESCIGCMKCSNIASSSFLMMDSGRARTFDQRAGGDVEQAVDACPVSCMHRVSFQELKKFETARDGDGELGREHSQRSHTPLHVAGIDSDANHRPSLYHTLRANCVTHSSCPTKGCYDCPSYRHPGENPFFVAKHKEAEHVRAQHFIQSGEATRFRKFVEL